MKNPEKRKAMKNPEKRKVMKRFETNHVFAKTNFQKKNWTILHESFFINIFRLLKHDIYLMMYWIFFVVWSTSAASSFSSSLGLGGGLLRPCWLSLLGLWTFLKTQNEWKTLEKQVVLLLSCETCELRIEKKRSLATPVWVFTNTLSQLFSTFKTTLWKFKYHLRWM